ncbi:MAG: hypothetical protein VB092_08975 [Oscillospiraceae bacterium]|nr:hypothetical protein [Oscillospiraceae bacterium]
MQFVEVPNLPKGRAALVLVSVHAANVAAALQDLGAEVLFVPDAPNLPSAVASHPDLNCLHLGGNVLAVNAAQDRLICALRSRGFQVIPQHGIDAKYPADCALNAIVGESGALSHKTALHGAVRAHLQKKGYSFHSTKQGYTRCSAALVAENAVATADVGICRYFRQMGADALLLPPGDIMLPGFDYGFIGGCCAKLDARTLVFTGCVSALSYYPQISMLCERHGVMISELCRAPIEDIGGILPLKETGGYVS